MPPKLSVVVLGDAPRLDECLGSLAAQTLRELEVVVVGSSAAGAWCERDGRFRTAERWETAATGEYVAFACGRVPAHAYEELVGSLERTGADVACGAVQGVRPGAGPRLLHDRTPWNKVFRRAFWDRAGLGFEDGPWALSAKAYALAKSVDVLPDAVCEPVEDGELAERLIEAGAVRAVVAEHAPGLLAAFDERVLVDELRALLDALPGVGERERDDLVGIGAALAGGLGPRVLNGLPAIERLPLHLLRLEMAAELLEVLRFVRDGGPGRTQAVRRGLRPRWYAPYPFIDDRRIPAHVYDVTDELVPVAAVDRARWVDGRLRIEGHAYIRHLDASAEDASRIRLWLVAGNRRGLLRVPVRRTRRPDVTADSGQSAVSYDCSGFVADIDPAALRIFGRWRTVDWIPCVEVWARGVRRRRTLGQPALTAQRWPEPYECAPDVLVGGVASKRRYVIQVRRVEAVVTSCRRAGGVLEIGGWARAGLAAGTAVTATRTGAGGAPATETVTGPVEAGPATASASGGRGTPFTARLPIVELGTPGEWRIALSGAGRPLLDGSVGGASWPAPGGHEELEPARTRRGDFKIVVRERGPVVARVGWSASGGVLVIAGSYRDAARGAGRPDAMILRHRGTGEERRVPLAWDGDRFSASFAPSRMPALGLARPLGSGRWDLLAPEAGPADSGTAGGPARGRGRWTPVPMRRDVLPALPERCESGFHRVSVVARRSDLLQLLVEPALADDERGPYAQERLRSGHYRRQLARPVRDLAVFEAYGGHQYSCNPRGVYDELRRRGTDLDCVWVTEDGAFGDPAGARTVLAGGREHYEALARARYVFGNGPQRPWFAGREGQTYVQCWHGTPLKRTPCCDAAHDVPHWDLLLAQNAFSAPILREAFGYDGPVLESGHPRNDILNSPHRDQIAAAVRRRLGVPDGTRVVLYAPARRDPGARHAKVGRGGAHPPERLAGRFDAALGGDHVLLLRGHHRTANDPSGRGAPLAPFPPLRSGPACGGHGVIDVSAYPDIAELYLVTDVLVTDYSSAMFDFAVTGRPIVLLVHDLEAYRDRVGGFHLDLEAEAPGPVLRAADDVLDALRDHGTLPDGRSEAYASFAARYCARDDGHAAARVLDHVMAAAPAAPR